MDEAAIKEFNHSYCGSKAYRQAVDLWKKPLEKKRIKREKRLQNPPAVMPPNETNEESIYIHLPEEGITLPPSADKIYAVIDVKGSQHKVSKDDMVILEKLIPKSAAEEQPNLEVGQQLIFDEVLLVGTQDYTSVGRPRVPNARVYGTLEQ